MEDISRRGFMGAAGMLAAMGAMGTAGIGIAAADEAAAADDDFVPGGGSFAEGALDLGWTGTPAAIAAAGNSTMPLAELNRRRRAYIDAQVEYTCADGTVVPVEYVRLRALYNTQGMGNGNAPSDTSFVRMLEDMTPEQAEFIVGCPMGVAFNVHEASAATGYPTDVCDEWLKELVHLGYIKCFHDNSGEKFCHMAYFQGSVEMIEWRGMSKDFRGDEVDVHFAPGITGANAEGGNYASDLVNGGSHQFRSVPCFESVVGDGKILAVDDIRAILKHTGTIGIAPCMCRYRAAHEGGDENLPMWEDFQDGSLADYESDAIGMRVECCIAMGDEAENWINKGYARRATPEEALELLERNMEDGFIASAMTNTTCETICSCHADAGCGILKVWSILGDSLPDTPMGRQVSAYDLVVDYDLCIACGMCEQRCPVHAITMDGEGGKPVVAGRCVKCGQCAYVCPQEARKLFARPAEEVYQLPLNMIEDQNMKAAWRFEHGAIV